MPTMSRGNASSFRLTPVVKKEDQEQIIVATWLTKNNIPFYHIPNGGRRNMLEAIKFKRMGVKAGIPDICVPVARSGYHGLYGELKRVSGGVVSEAQEYWLAELKRQGYYVFVGNGADEFIQHVKKYMEVL
jgi:VRR-NUC domain-containing protein